jgi:hypothetical protein
MDDRNLNPVGCLGRALTFLGIVWIGIIILGSIGLLSELGMTGDFLAGIGGSIIPGLLLLAAGRGLRRRAKTMEGQPGPVIAPPQGSDPGKRVATSRTEPTTSTGPATVLTPPRVPTSEPLAPRPQVKPAPKPVVPTRRDVTRSLEEALPPLDQDLPEKTLQTSAMDLKPPPPKTSRELVDEARKRWGGDKPR